MQQKTIEIEAYEIWKDSKGDISSDDLAMLTGLSVQRIEALKLSTWKQNDIKPGEKIPYKPNTSKYRTHVEPYLKDIAKWISKGIPDCEIRQKLGIDHNTWIRFKKEESELREIYSIKKELLVIGLEKSLYKKAHGYNYTEITKEKVLDPKTMTYKLEVSKEVEKQVAPDSTAIIFALSNLDPENWKQKVEHSNTFIQVNTGQLEDIKKQMGELMNEYKSLELDDTQYVVVEDNSAITK